METYQRLRQARKAHGLDLRTLEERTRVRVHLLSALETGRFEELPSGLYARAVVRSYAQAVGLDPDEILQQLAPLLPGVEDPIDGWARVRGFARRPPRAGPAPEVFAPMPAVPALRMSLATATDCAILVAIDLGLLLVSARVCGVANQQLVDLALPAWLMLWSLFAGLYFLLFGGLAGATPGTWLAGILPAASGRVRVDVSVARKRACEFALREASILVELLMATERGQHCLRALRVLRT